MDVNLEMDPKLLLKKYEQDINVSAEGCFFRVLLVSRDLKGRNEDHFRGSLPRSALFFNLPMLIIKQFGVDSKERGFCSVIASALLHISTPFRFLILNQAGLEARAEDARHAEGSRNRGLRPERQRQGADGTVAMVV